MSEKEILLGNEAIARGTYEAGVEVSAACPDTPSMKVNESLVQYDEIYTEWAPNEKVATEVAVDASIAGARSMCVMKHTGINVAADPLYTAVYTGIRGGLMLVVADDLGMYSSQDEQDSHIVARAAMVPIVEPSDSAEAEEFMKYTYDLSEKYDTPVILRNTTCLSHSQGLAESEERVEPFGIPCERDIAKYVMMPGNAIKRRVVVEARMKQMAKDANSFPIDRVEYNDLSVGFITNGIAYQYMKEAMPQASVLKLGPFNPLPRELIEGFVSKVDKLYIFEELEPVVEGQVKFWGIKKAVGKEIFTVQEKYSANLVREHVLGQASQVDKAAQVPTRPPILCPGCLHRSVYAVFNKLRIHAAGDIGCCTLGAVAPLSVIDTTICMGAGISTLHNMEKTKGREYIKDWAAIIDDSTFMHIGINSLVNVVYNQAAGTMVILDNSTTGMTRHQDHVATGKILKGQVVPAIDIYGLYEPLGIEYVCEVDDFNQAELERIIKKEVARDVVSVIITKVPCTLLKGIKFPSRYRPLPDKCKKCGACLRPGCLALTKSRGGTTFVDGIMYNGYGLCEQLCKFSAINLIKTGE